MVQTSTLVVGEKEQLVLYDRTTESATKHIPAQLRRRQDTDRGTDTQAILPLVGVEKVITEKLKHISVVAVGT